MSVYQVTGQLDYRGHRPGTRFEATLDPRAEQRAVNRGSIRLLERSTPMLEPGSYTLPARPA